MDSVRIGLHGSDIAEFVIRPYGVVPEPPPITEPPPIPLWKIGLVVLSIIGGTAAGVAVAKRKGKEKK